MPCPIKPCLSTLLAAVISFIPAWAAAPPPGPRITAPVPVQPPALSVLARQLTTADPDQQWEFAAITLDVLLDVYSRELSNSVGETASTAARRAKLARWQRATQGLINQIELARLSLAQGGRFSLYVDPRHQILIIVEGQTVVVSGPHASAEDQVSSPVLEQFCAYNDCSVLRNEVAQETKPEPGNRGVWILRQGTRPAYQVGDDLRCEFDTLENRVHKAGVCTRLATELRQFAAALEHAARQSHTIDWALVLKSPPASRHPYLVVNGEGAYIETDLKLLTKADRDAWQDAVEWSRRWFEGRSGRLAIIRAGQFLGD